MYFRVFKVLIRMNQYLFSVNKYNTDSQRLEIAIP